MIVSVQVDNLEYLEKALSSDCNRIRFGPEFCENLMPSLDCLKKSYALTLKKGKDFTFVSPKLSNQGLKGIESLLKFLDQEGNVSVVFNDLGLLSILERFRNLKPHMGRQLVYIPARCPWPEITVGGFPKRWLSKISLSKIFYQTSLNYELTTYFFQNYGVKSVDVDWIPKCFPYYRHIVESGFNLSLYLYLVPVTITRKCHTARLLGEKEWRKCSRRCEANFFVLERDDLEIKLFLFGNAVFKMTGPKRSNLKKISRLVSEIVIPLNPVTKTAIEEDFGGISELITELKSISA